MASTLVVNLFGGPGVGKSTLMAATFAKLKWNGYTVEMAPEWAKEQVWERDLNVMGDQFFVAAQQAHRIERLIGEVDAVITDSPILLGEIYSNDVALHKYLHAKFIRYKSINFLVGREKKFDPKGRLQSLEQAKDLDSKIEDMLQHYLIDYTKVIGAVSSVDTIVKHVSLRIDSTKDK